MVQLADGGKWRRRVQAWQAVDWRDWPEAPPDLQALILGICGVLWLALVGWVLWPQWEALEALRGQLQAAQSQRSAGPLAEAAWRQRQDVLADALAQREAWQGRLPSAPCAHGAEVALQTLAQRHRLRLEIGPSVSASRQAKHLRQSLSLKGEGDFHDWGRWLAELVASRPVMWVQSLDATAAPQAPLGVLVRMTVACGARLPDEEASP